MSISRTNETDMNAQSSCSYAIFSLTLTQKKLTGSGVHHVLPLFYPSGRSPSCLAHPGSVYSRVASPTFGCPLTPSFAAAMGRGSGDWLQCIKKCFTGDNGESSKPQLLAAEDSAFFHAIHLQEAWRSLFTSFLFLMFHLKSGSRRYAHNSQFLSRS